MQKILITGISGFLGSWLLKETLKRYPNVEVTALMRNKPIITNNMLNEIDLSNVRIITGSITDYNLIDYIVSRYEIDTIFNFAANSIVRTCQEMPLHSLMDNVYGSACVLEAARNHKTVKQIIQFASDKSYGEAKELPYKEDETPLKGMRPYECTKTLIDMWSQMYQKNYNVPVTVIRSANLYGPGDPNSSRLLPQVCTNIAMNKNPWLYSGVADYIREFVYIEDAVDYIFNLVEKCELNESLKYECYNLGTGNIFSIKDLVQKIIDISGKNLKIDIKEKELPFMEIKEQYLSLDKSVNKLEWKAYYTGEMFDVSLTETYNYYHGLIS